MADKKFKLDIFKVLSLIDRRDFSAWKRLSKEEQKAFAAPVILRWLSSANDIDYQTFCLVMTNEANIWLNDLYSHPELQYLLMCATGNGKKIRHSWIAGPKRRKMTSKIDELIMDKYPFVNEEEMNLFKQKLDENSVKTLGEDAGLQEKEVKALVKEYKKIK